MTEYAKLSPAALQAEYDAVSKAFEAVKQKNLKLDMSRGKPGKAQLDLVSDILTVLTKQMCIRDRQKTVQIELILLG